jgi:hypothetical protein
VIEPRGQTAVALNLFDRGPGHGSHLQSAFPIGSEITGLNLMPQSYVGKRAISEKDRRTIRKFVVFAPAVSRPGTVSRGVRVGR